jgi:hypothetical protein
MAKYADRTAVPVSASKAEIERILSRFGADQFMIGWETERALIAFRAQGRHIKMLLPLPAREKFSTANSYEAEQRRVWRSMALCIKAKVESVSTGIETFEDSFMAHVVLPNGETLAQHARPLIARAYESGEMPKLLPHLQ